MQNNTFFSTIQRLSKIKTGLPQFVVDCKYFAAFSSEMTKKAPIGRKGPFLPRVI
jgi:hypothetical protein